MDSFFGMGLWEMGLIVLIAFIIFGPRDLARHAFTIGKKIAEFSRQSRTLLNALSEQLQQEAELDDLREDVRNLTGEMRSVRDDITNLTDGILTPGKKAAPGKSQPRGAAPPNARPVEPPDAATSADEDEFAQRTIAPPPPVNAWVPPPEPKTSDDSSPDQFPTRASAWSKPQKPASDDTDSQL